MKTQKCTEDVDGATDDGNACFSIFSLSDIGATAWAGFSLSRGTCTLRVRNLNHYCVLSYGNVNMDKASEM